MEKSGKAAIDLKVYDLGKLLTDKRFLKFRISSSPYSEIFTFRFDEMNRDDDDFDDSNEFAEFCDGETRAIKVFLNVGNAINLHLFQEEVSKLLDLTVICRKEKAKYFLNILGWSGDSKTVLNQGFIMDYFPYRLTSYFFVSERQWFNKMLKGELGSEHLFLDNYVTNPFYIYKKLKMLLEIAKGINFLHTVAKISHRNIKASNIMLDRNLNPKIVGFIFSEPLKVKLKEVIEKEEKKHEPKPKKKGGIFSFLRKKKKKKDDPTISEKLLQVRNLHGRQVSPYFHPSFVTAANKKIVENDKYDGYSFGVLMYSLFFLEEKISSLRERVLKRKSEWQFKLIRRCLSKDTKLIPRMQEVVNTIEMNLFIPLQINLIRLGFHKEFYCDLIVKTKVWSK